MREARLPTPRCQGRAGVEQEHDSTSKRPIPRMADGPERLDRKAGETRPTRASAEHFKANLGHTTGGNPKLGGGSMGQIDDPGAVERTAVVDADDGTVAVQEVGDPNPGPKGKGSMGSGEGAAAKDFTTGRTVAIEAWAVPAGLPHAHLNHPGLLGSGNGKTGSRENRILLRGSSFLGADGEVFRSRSCRAADGDGLGTRGCQARIGQNRNQGATAGQKDDESAEGKNALHNNRNPPPFGSCNPKMGGSPKTKRFPHWGKGRCESVGGVPIEN